MSQIDVNNLLKEVSTEDPCGEDLEYDTEFGEMERATQGKPEQQIGDTYVPAEEADWAAVTRKAISLFKKTKDLRVAVYLAQSLIHTQGLSGFSRALNLIQGLLEQYWDSVHPKLEPGDESDVVLRVNTLASLCDPDTVLHSIRDATLVDSKVFGRISLRDIYIAQGTFTLPEATDEKPLDMTSINAAFMDAAVDDLVSTSGEISDAIASVGAIESLLMDKVGSMQMADFSPLLNLLKEVQQIMSEHLTQRGVNDSDMPAEVAVTGADVQTGEYHESQTLSAINSREDVIRALDMVCDYFSKHEPSSPVPLLLQRAKRLVSKDFMEIMRDLIPAGVSQAEEIGGSFTQKQ